MNTPRDDMPEHDPQISALYRKTGDIAPPASLDEAVLATARRAVHQRRQRWMLPLSTAAVLMLGITVLLKLNSEWQPNADLEGGTPASTAHEEKLAEASAGMLSRKAAPAAAPKPQTLKAAPPSLATVPSDQPRRTAREKSEIAESMNFSADTEPMSDSAVQTTDKRKENETPVLSGMALAEKEVLEPKPWLEKIQKLLEEKKPDEVKKELQAFTKRYPDYKLPDNLKVLLP